MQEIIYLSALSLGVIKGMSSVERYVQVLLEAELDAAYKLERLLS